MSELSPLKIIALYESRAESYDANYSNRWLGPGEVAKRVSLFFNKASGSSENMKMLDLGIGTGLLSEAVKKAFPSCSITGVDLSQAMLDKCAEKKIADELRCVDAQVDGLPYADESFDIAVSSGVFELLEQPEKVIAEMSRVLRPGGLLAFSNLKTSFFGAFTDIAHPDAPLRSAIEKSGIEIDDVTEFVSYAGTDWKHDIYAGHKKPKRSV